MKTKSKLIERPVRMPEIGEGRFVAVIEAYKAQIGTINMELPKASRFAMLLDDLFSGGNLNRKMLAEYLQNVEKNIKTVGEGSTIIRGRPDALFGNAIIEFKQILDRAHLDDAVGQLRRYAGILRAYDETDYVGIATDGQLFVAYSTLVEGTTAHLTEIERIDIRTATPDGFYYWLDRYFLRRKPLEATSEYFVKDFGPESHALHLIERRLTEAFEAHKDDSQVKTLYEEWDKYVRVAYGSKVYGPDLFVRHTYLASLAKLLAWIRIESDDTVPEYAPTLKIFDGSYFHDQGIINFLENDFFSWIALDIPDIVEMREYLSERFLSLLRAYHLHGLSEDVMKALYQGLVDPKQRHDLGEYYTPDWLADLMTTRALKDNPEARTLDPTCGSGTFVYSVIRYKIKALGSSKETLNHILDNVVGIDIHPLAIIIAKTNYILGLGDLLAKRSGNVHIPVYLANSIAPPKEVMHAELFVKVACYRIYIEKRRGLGIPMRFVDSDRNLFDPAIDKVSEYAKTRAGKGDDERVFNTLIGQVKGIEPDERKPLYQLAQAMRELIEQRKDSIWAFVVKNSHRPVMMQAQFDLLIGNPPWLTFKDLETADYQERIKGFIGEHQLEIRAQNMTHLELAALFWVRGSKLYLKQDGKIAFVMPRSVFNAQHHDRLRKGTFLESGVRVREVWDMNSNKKELVSNLFKVPSCVLFGSFASAHDIIQKYPIPAKTFSGRLSEHNARLLSPTDGIVARTSAGDLSIRESLINLKTTKSSSAWDEIESSTLKQSDYYKRFFEGATLVPRSLWFVEPEKAGRIGINVKAPFVHTDPRAIKEAKAPYKDILLSGPVEREYLFATLLSTDLIPFGHLPIRPIVLPAVLEPIKLASGEVRVGNHLKMIDAKIAERKAHFRAAKWFEQAQELRESRKNTEKDKATASEYLNYRNKISEQNSRTKYRVLYPMSASRLCASIVHPSDLRIQVGEQYIRLKGFVVDYKCYYCETNDLQEAEYLSAVLNSRTLETLVIPFMTKGFAGAPRDIVKKVLEFPIPLFDPEDSSHLRLVELAQAAEEKARDFQKASPPTTPITPRLIGSYRNKVREVIREELDEIDEIVAVLLKG